MPDGFEVHPAALQQYAQLVREQAAQLQQVQQVHQVLAGVHLPAGAFGKLPESADMDSAYAQHASAEVTNTAELPGLLDQLARGLDSAAANYRTAESFSTQSASSVTAELGGAG